APWAQVVPAADGQGPRRMSAAGLFALGDEGSHHELVEGVLVQMTPPSGEHGVLTSEIGAALGAAVKAARLGQVLTGEPGFLISHPGEPDTVLAPDVAFVRAERIPAKGTPERQGYWRLAPDLVVEVASPSQRKNEMAAKALVWLAAGVRLVWVVWPEARQVDAWSPGADRPARTYAASETLDGGAVVPGFRLDLAALFAA
ncbi:MAG TPA: Uma2 family endonuclease, partial [Ktedonobacterales bacterium]|nr:Uma2 family endonuclease [Ktedonobacterales bacterium]